MEREREKRKAAEQQVLDERRMRKESEALAEQLKGRLETAQLSLSQMMANSSTQNASAQPLPLTGSTIALTAPLKKRKLRSSFENAALQQQQTSAPTETFPEVTTPAAATPAVNQAADYTSPIASSHDDDSDSEELFMPSHNNRELHDGMAEAKAARTDSAESPAINEAVLPLLEVKGSASIEKGWLPGCTSPSSSPGSVPSSNLFKDCTANVDIAADGTGSLKFRMSDGGAIKTTVKKIKSLKSGPDGVDTTAAAELGVVRFFFKDSSCFILNVGEENARGFARAVQQAQLGRLSA